jgi:hypothetical protein
MTNIERMTLYEAGQSDKQIGNATFYTSAAIASWRYRLGLPINKFNKALDKQRMELYLLNKSDSEIADATDRTKSGVQHWRKSNNLPSHFKAKRKGVAY